MILSLDGAKPNDVVAMGRSTVDLYANEIGPLEEASTFSKYVGGSPANTAVAMAKLGMKVGYIGKVADDPFGRYIVNYLNGAKVDTSHIKTAQPGIRCGVTIGEILPDKCNYFVYRKDCADLHIECSELDEEYIASHKIILISGTSLSHSPAREAVFKAIALAKRNNVKVAFDLDYRDYTWDDAEKAGTYLTLAAEQADVVLGTRDEFDIMESLYYGEVHDDSLTAQRLIDRGVTVVSIKKGKQGSHVYTKNSMTTGGIYQAKVLKTFGAGDSYSGAFMYGLVHDMQPEESLRYAAAASAITISGHSCSGSMPTLGQVEEYMARHEYIMP
ncbi:5-dehydro-2-deoxygluconokinase [Cloacibacillus sp. An23]|uniref:5-dehydro-2-deoxygluconokinase n=1 Tax=Cloacibacillus sp. An23 TaxID=1965591 RepID=UPI000B39508D|nr:5-dehydro-2-deoxygluconokinase [Cloacibacillus sp. An23]OUO93322.1 5-dehydro-2-deoxygluconokinase [Cloacibacillus sp. An23]